MCLITAFWLEAGASYAMAPACRTDNPAEANASASVKKEVRDPATGLVIRLEETGVGHMTVDVADGQTSIHKDLHGRVSTTTIGVGRERLVLAFDGSELEVTGLKKPLRGSIAAPESLSALFSGLKGSPLVRSAQDLLDRLALQADSPEGNALLLTRALLGALIGEVSSAKQYQQWTRHTLETPRVVRAVEGRTPGDCWDLYASEALRIFDDYAQCFMGCRWYQPFCESSCEAIYALRAEMAFMWFFNCNGPFYVG